MHRRPSYWVALDRLASRRFNSRSTAFRTKSVLVATVVSQLYLVPMLQRTLPPGSIAPCLPTKTDKLPSGSQWLHEIKHDGFRIIARKNGAQVRLAKTSLSGPVEGPPVRATAASPAQGQSGQNRQLLFGSPVCAPSGGVHRPSERKNPRAQERSSRRRRHRSHWQGS